MHAGLPSGVVREERPTCSAALCERFISIRSTELNCVYRHAWFVAPGDGCFTYLAGHWLVQPGEQHNETQNFASIPTNDDTGTRSAGIAPAPLERLPGRV